VDNKGYIVAPLTVRAVNQHDTMLFPESLERFVEHAQYAELSIYDSFITLDSGFDSSFNRSLIESFGLIPVIKPNRRSIEDPEKLLALYEEFDYFKDVYEERYKVERTFAWQDTYRKLVIRYERLQCTFTGFRYLAYSMINLRTFFNRF